MKPTSFNPNDFESSEEFIRGYQSESAIAHILRKDGYFVTITADTRERGRNGAPSISNDSLSIAMPDLLVAAKGHCGWCEVKYKGDASFTIKTQRPEHGIGIRKFERYQYVQKETGNPVYLFIHENKSGAILYSLIDDLLPVARYYYGDKMDPGGMIFFPRASFGLWGKIAEVNGHLFTQLSFLDGIDIDGEGDKLFKVIRHYFNGVNKRASNDEHKIYNYAYD